MANITAADVKALRELTDLPMMDCKKALVAAEGDQEKAIEIMREKAGKVMLKRADNATSEGKVFIKMSDDGSKTVMLALECESPPVAGSEDFVNFGNLCVNQLLNGPGATTPEELTSQSPAECDGKSLNDVYEEMVNKIREKIVLAKVTVVDGPVGGYVHHDGKTGVLFQATGDVAADDSILRDVAMHIAALKPTCTNIEDVDAAVVQAERDKLTEEAKATGKPDNIIEKIVDGRMNSFYVEQGVLVLQPYAKDDSKTVSQALAEKGLTAAGFTRWVLGAN